MKRMKKHVLSSNMEDYLETILSLKRDKGVARVRDISKRMNVKASSVSAALKLLSDNGLIVHERYGYVDLTQAGKSRAELVQSNHDTIKKFLMRVLGVEKGIADEDACKIEHNVSPQTLVKISEYINYFEANHTKKNTIYRDK